VFIGGVECLIWGAEVGVCGCLGLCGMLYLMSFVGGVGVCGLL